MTVTKPEVVFSLRLPADLHAEATTRAAVEERSLNALVRVALRAYLDANTPSH